MKTFIVERYAKTGAVRAAERPEPEVEADEVLVHVEAAGVNPLDSKIAVGEFKLILPYRPPFVLGHDVAGVVARVGSAVTHFAPGDTVYARPRDFRVGTFAELVAVKERDLALKPSTISYEEAASLPLVALTAWQALVEKGRVSPGQKVFIHAGSGGVGTIAIQLAKHLGAFVATTTSTANVEWVKSLGADVVIDYKSEDFEKVLSGYDLVLDSLGPDSIVKSLTILKPGGIAIGIGGPPDPIFAREIGANAVVKVATRLLSRKVRKTARRLGVRYSFLFMTASGAQLREIAALVDTKAIQPVVDRVYPFDETLDALDYVDTGRVKGKVVVSMG
ncbi:NADP-dependent oxidoreductase [Aeromicrobium ginsengisoli]|uniref:NADP-dependent oxidoreductase n=1 Tax=Aeromicrobium ginsengisoli TaxID=363867 RepID=A0A5M4FEN9_9ACTN|nr:NADP-dependent oxidoreductase [Aeromicrobium ginsengisoli]KAA1397817.1 NADP-dependent oxidoreductase [Aeromicrobium ginsengisoli]